MKGRELQNMGIPKGKTVKLAQRLIGAAARSGLRKQELRSSIEAVVRSPEEHTESTHFAELALALVAEPTIPPFVDREEPAPWRKWGDDIDESACEQMRNACRLPISVAGALMPDAHLGYGLPIGGVLATAGAVVPYAVGFDIACRMRLTVLDLPVSALRGQKDRLANVLEANTRFGMGAHFDKPHDHEVLDQDWEALDITRGLKAIARSQLGSSGSGNHFVEFGTIELPEDDLGLAAGEYVALLSHSGSRGPGAKVAGHYTKLAKELHPELPKQLRHLAWLDMDLEPGQEYWAAMQLMGAYAAANHEVIHRTIAKALRSKPLAHVENHHNFAWMERHQGRDVIVHRKGATPAGEGVEGVIPGSMATPGYVVRGRGFEHSLNSASHGAGRALSRRKAASTFTWSAVKKVLAERGVTVLSAGIDEVPGAYKDIDSVMEAQRELVDTIGRFEPKIVKMADSDK